MKQRDQWWDGVREAPLSILNPGESRRVPLLRTPVSTVSHITSYGVDDTATVFAAAGYILDDSGPVPEVVLRDGYLWPTDLRAAKAIKIELVGAR